ncbi:MAG TPA: metallophosphoesterase family protein [Candidatus Acidoferrum sp.]|nr:metallophosphoesterase family protein [Candidatus Acidoferrum sp.]
MRLGIISDTHGLLRPEAARAMSGVDLIVHAGDVGKPEVLTHLKAIAPVFAVRGNVDTEAWAAELPATAIVDAGSAMLYVLHNLRELDMRPDAAGFDAVISGHTHQAEQWEREGVLYLNPGSAGPRRFNLPITLALVDVGRAPWKVEIVELLGV